MLEEVRLAVASAAQVFPLQRVYDIPERLHHRPGARGVGPAHQHVQISEPAQSGARVDRLGQGSALEHEQVQPSVGVRAEQFREVRTKKGELDEGRDLVLDSPLGQALGKREIGVLIHFLIEWHGSKQAA